MTRAGKNGEGRQNGEEAGASPPLTSKGKPDRRFRPHHRMTPARLAHLPKAHEAAADRSGFEILAQMNPEEGHWSWESSPHVLWLANVLSGVVYE